jgi:aspartyl-tRNA(Asn)/glutamyl-tRNA(Gln) amidotransferase subunit C
MNDISIDHLAKLARIRVTDDEKKALEKDLPAILDYISKLQEVDTSQIEVNAYLTNARNIFREDNISADESEKRAIIESFPKKTGNALEVPAVFE